MSYQEYEDALKYANALLKVEPENRQAQSLKQYIQDKMKKGEIPYLLDYKSIFYFFDDYI